MFGGFMALMALCFLVGEFISDNLITPWLRRRQILKGEASQFKMMNTEYENRTGLQGATGWPPMTKDEEFEETTKRG